ncbi:hypothetical protein [Sphingomonas sp.]|uniref:hypothetical protein n=1 Tax=Sphingomonas sp. TaxID=28214 RepID=UPI0035C7C474
MRRVVAAAVLAALAACSSPDQPGQLTADEDARLNRAAEMLDANSVAFKDAGDNVTASVENEQ